MDLLWTAQSALSPATRLSEMHPPVGPERGEGGPTSRTGVECPKPRGIEHCRPVITFSIHDLVVRSRKPTESTIL